MITYELDGQMQSVILVILKSSLWFYYVQSLQIVAVHLKVMNPTGIWFNVHFPLLAVYTFFVIQIVPPISFYCDCCSFFRTT